MSRLLRREHRVSVRGTLAVTDPAWLATLRETNASEGNFWQPRPTTVKNPPGTPWIFKVRGTNLVAGFGFFSYYTVMPLAVAWESFQEANGVRSYSEMFRRVDLLRRNEAIDDNVGCVVLSELTILPEKAWIPAPNDWRPNIVRIAGYDLAVGEGLRVWNQLLAMSKLESTLSPLLSVAGGKGEPALYLPRLGQGGFRVMVIDAYQRKCAITGEKTLPALEAAHIRPFAEHPTHEVRNGILMRGDLHKLYDRGYVTIDETKTFRVSPTIAREFDNGKIYYALDGREIDLPRHPDQQPDRDALAWHAAKVFRK